MRREGRGWIHNAAQGARCVGALPPEPYQQLAVRAAAAVGLDYAGVDLIASEEAADGAVVLEVNGVAAWHKLQRATGIDIAALLVDDLLLRKLPQVQASRAA